MAYSIFISYRRKNATWFAGRLYDSLRNNFNGIKIFMDVGALRGGNPYKKMIDQAVNECEVFIPIIDEEWTTVKDETTGKKRLFMKDDLVAYELERALFQEKIIVPVLIENTKMPAGKDLPSALKRMVDFNSERLKHESWERDIESLFKTLSGYVVLPGKKYEAFISVPMTGFDDPTKYENLKSIVAEMVKSLKTHCKWDTVYFSGDNFKDLDNIDPEDIGAQIDLAAIKESENFIMVYPEKVSSSCLVEAGYALALNLPSIYFYKDEQHLPYMLKKAPSAYPFIKTYRYKDSTDLDRTIQILSKSILKKN